MGETPGRFTKEELRGLETLHESLAEVLQARLRRAGRGAEVVAVQFVDQVTFAEFQSSRPAEGWSYSYLAGPLDGPAIFDLPLATARAIDPDFAALLVEVIAGTRDLDTLEEGAHKRFAGPLFEDIEAAWAPALRLEMHDIEFEADPATPRMHVAEPSAVVAYVQLATGGGEVAMRLCYPHQTFVSVLPSLARFGARS